MTEHAPDTIDERPADGWDAIEEFALPADTARSRIKPAGPPAVPAEAREGDEDIVTTAQRLTKFRRLCPEGVIQTEVEYDPRVEGYTATARVWREKPSITRNDGTPITLPDAIAHATRTYSSTEDPITRARPQEAAETAAVGRALRFLGINPPKPRKPKAS